MDARQNYAPVTPPAPQGQAHQHAARLHDLAAQFAEQNHRLSSLVSRLLGPEPPSNTVSGDAKEPEPSGVLYVAAFGAERIARESKRLGELISRLEQVA